MNYTFFDPPADYNNPRAATIISGDESKTYTHTTYLLIKEALYEIKFKQPCGPFKKALLQDNILAVGHQCNFYLFDIARQQHILTLPLNQYFGNIYQKNGLFYITDSSGVHCVSPQGDVHWHNGELGTDGVMIHEFQGEKVYGSGEWSPPSGWEDFVLELATGKPVK
ncbi:hypothetical protein [Microscilla marina]|uniref:Uncharacterized protein n=1 Tax=Microscilla marina ATCC 23134 TaxID=313606 RepID=A1ZRB8_MICM2|nr:hypothetical protein [Microscilla marina]EAY27008.1 conserved hypothetical protein [Microscilla marina ATCC 23134]